MDMYQNLAKHFGAAPNLGDGERFYIAVRTEEHRRDHPFGRFGLFVSAENWKKQKRQYPKTEAGTRLFELAWKNDQLEITEEIT